MPMQISTRADDADKHGRDVNHLLFHKGKVYSAGDDGKIKVWSNDLTLLGQVQAHTRSVYSLAASNDTLFSCSNEGTVKGWELDTLKEKGTIITDPDCEFWVIRWADDVLYFGDDTGNVKIYKKGSSFGSINVAEPVKGLVVHKNLLFTSKDNDVVITDLHLGGDKPQFGIKKTMMGRSPLAVINNKLVFSTREGKDLTVVDITGHFDKPTLFKGAHEMIINALKGADWDGKISLFSGGWDKVVKHWKFDNDNIKLEESCPVDLVINTMAAGDSGKLYVGGSDGHIISITV